MAVTIDLELNAGDVEAEILGIAGALQTLDKTAGEIDLDFDGIDVDEINGEIGNMVETLEGLELDLSSLEKDISRIEKLQDGDISLSIDDPDGSTNKGDSTGNDPPSGLVHKLSEFADAGGTPTGTTADGGERANLLERTYGEHTFASNDFLGDWLQKPKNSKTSNLGRSDPDFTDSIAGMRIGTRGEGLGLDPVSMNLRRMEAELDADKFGSDSDDDIAGTRLKHLARKGRFDNARRASNFDNDIEFAKFTRLLQKQKDNTQELADKINQGSAARPFQDLNADLRKQEGLSRNEVLESVGGSFPDSMEGVNYDSSKTIPDDAEASFGGMRLGDKTPDVDLRDRDKSLRGLTPLPLGDEGGIMPQVSKFNDKLGKKLRKLKPTMGKYMQLLAALIPIAVALGVQLLGVAAAMGAVAAAGAGIMALGLLGHGESMADSYKEAKLQLSELKRELFEVSQPTMQQFAPIQARMFDSIPGALQDPLEEMQGLQAFEGTLFQMGGDFVGGLEELFEIINRNEEAISQLSVRFGGLIGSGLLEFFEFLIQSASENKALLLQLGKDMVMLVAAAYNLSMALAQVLSNFTPLFKVIVLISELLRNDILVTIIALVGWMYVIGKVAGVFWLVHKGILAIAGAVGKAALAMQGYEIATWKAYLATAALAGLLTGGLALLGSAAGLGTAKSVAPDVGSSSDYGSGNYGGGNTIVNNNQEYNIDNSGPSNYADRMKLVDEFERKDAQELPST